jgi:uncharacterized protein (DUF1697 family)
VLLRAGSADPVPPAAKPQVPFRAEAKAAYQYDLSGSQNPMRYALFLRGINVGGAKKVPMAELRAMFESLGFENVKTLQNAGNAVFETKTSRAGLIPLIEKTFTATFGFESQIKLRTFAQIEQMIALDPFKTIKTGKDVRLYVTFLRGKSKSRLPLPHTSETGIQILRKTDSEVFTALNLKTAHTLEAMAMIEKEFGKDVTTRNWNTILKIAAL